MRSLSWSISSRRADLPVAARFPADAEAVTWPARRRAGLCPADLDALGAPTTAAEPRLAPVTGTDEALGRLYVLEGSTLGGTFIDRHLATLPHLVPGGRLRAFTPYGEDTGSMWHGFRRFTRAHVAGGGDAGRVVAAAGATFRALADRCATVAPPTRPG